MTYKVKHLESAPPLTAINVTPVPGTYILLGRTQS